MSDYEIQREAEKIIKKEKHSKLLKLLLKLGIGSIAIFLGVLFCISYLNFERTPFTWAVITLSLITAFGAFVAFFVTLSVSP